MARFKGRGRERPFKALASHGSQRSWAGEGKTQDPVSLGIKTSLGEPRRPASASL